MEFSEALVMMRLIIAHKMRFTCELYKTTVAEPQLGSQLADKSSWSGTDLRPLFVMPCS